MPDEPGDSRNQKQIQESATHFLNRLTGDRERAGAPSWLWAALATVIASGVGGPLISNIMTSGQYAPQIAGINNQLSSVQSKLDTSIEKSNDLMNRINSQVGLLQDHQETDRRRLDDLSDRVKEIEKTTATQVARIEGHETRINNQFDAIKSVRQTVTDILSGLPSIPVQRRQQMPANDTPLRHPAYAGGLQAQPAMAEVPR